MAESNSSEFSKDDFKKFSRFMVEELLRRSLSKDKQPMTQEKTLEILFPERNDFLEKFKQAKQKQAQEQLEAQQKSGDKFALFLDRAKELRSKDTSISEDDQIK